MGHTDRSSTRPNGGFGVWSPGEWKITTVTNSAGCSRLCMGVPLNTLASAMSLRSRIATWTVCKENKHGKHTQTTLIHSCHPLPTGVSRPLKATRLLAFLWLVPTVFKEQCGGSHGVGAGVWTEDAYVQVWPCTSWWEWFYFQRGQRYTCTQHCTHYLPLHMYMNVQMCIHGCICRYNSLYSWKFAVQSK